MADAAVPRAQTSTIVAVLVALAVSLVVAWSWLFDARWVTTLERATYGLVQAPLVASIVTAALIGAILWISAVPFAALGLRGRDLPRGIGVLVLVYVGIQLGLGAAALLAGESLQPGAALERPAGDAIGAAIAQLFGVALVEEAVFRGFLLRQFIIRTRARAGEGLRATVVAVALAALVFALWHVPQHLHLGFRGGYLVASLAFVAGGGVLASYLYLRGRNLLVVVALHAAFNHPVPLVASPVHAQWVLAVIVLCMIAWMELQARGRIAPRTGTRGTGAKRGTAYEPPSG